MVSTQSPHLEVRALTKTFGNVAAVNRISFSLMKGQFLSLLGPSGCGKTTTLRMIAGFLTPDDGQILYEGKDITFDPPYRRDFGLVFQNYALFPHMSVAQNIAFGLKMRKASKATIRERVQWALELVRLVGFEDRRPHQLSGGQQQRVAVARVLAAGASVLLMDEPFSNLDAKLRRDMQVELRELQQRLGISTLHVTHDQHEAMFMSDVLVVLNHGDIEQTGRPADIYRRPQSEFVAEFMGHCNRLPGVVTQQPGQSAAETISFDLKGAGRLRLPWDASRPIPQSAIALVRPEHIAVGPRDSFQDPVNVLPGVVDRVVYLGPITMLDVRLSEGVELLVELHNPPDGTQGFDRGVRVDVRIPPSSIRLIERGMTATNVPHGPRHDGRKSCA